tara:strand:+ start:437 stop:811 length:375 start_codon:yes stop_codon:yes gene_type:complete
MTKNLFLSGVFFCALSVVMGAFGAHSLKDKLSQYSMSIYDKAVLYQFFHAIAILFVAVLNKIFDTQDFSISGILLIIGILLFSGSLFILAITDMKWLGAITPIGGTLFIVGWLILFIKILKIEI